MYFKVGTNLFILDETARTICGYIDTFGNYNHDHRCSKQNTYKPLILTIISNGRDYNKIIVYQILT